MSNLPDYHCPECDDIDCLHCFCVEGTDCESCAEFVEGEQPDHLGKAIQATVWAYTEGEQK